MLELLLVTNGTLAASGDNNKELWWVCTFSGCWMQNSTRNGQDC